MASYLKKEISEWNTTDLCNWLLANKFRGISELFQKYSLSGYDLFYIDDDILKNELNLKSFHERKVALKLITKLTYEHLKLNVINSNGDNVILTLDNNPETKLGEISDYIGNMFNIDPKDILFKDSTKQEVLSPTVKIVQLLILYPKIYKTLNVSNMKDYRQPDEELMESGSGEFAENNVNSNLNTNFRSKASEIGLGSMSGMMASGEMDFQDMNHNNNNNQYNNNNNNNNYKMKNNQNMNFRGNNKMSKNNNYNYNENKKMRENENIQNNNRDNKNDNMNYKYNNNYMNMNNNKMNNNRRQNNNNNDNFLLNSGSGDNNPPDEINDNKMNMNGSSSNIDYNNMNFNRKQNYMVDNDNAADFKDNRGNNNERRNKNYQFNQMNNNNEMMDNMMNYNEDNNFGLLSSANDDEMKFKPSYQIKGNDNNNFREYQK